jgi:hypothetical protein
MPYYEMFFKHEYSVTKDLIQAFLTLLSGILVFSLTFGEKIVTANRSSSRARALLITAWSCFILSIMACGVALPLISMALGVFIYGGIPLVNFSGVFLATASWALVIGAGVIFVLGQCLLTIAAAISLRARAQ